MNSDLTALNLSVRSYNGLRRAGWKTVEDIINHIDSDQDLNKIRNLGKTSIQEIMTRLFEYNMSLLSAGEIEIFNRQFETLNRTEDTAKNLYVLSKDLRSYGSS